MPEDVFPSELFAALTVLMSLLVAGCGMDDSRDVPPASNASAPPVQTAPALPDDGGMTVSELQRELKKKNPGYSGQGKFRKAGGEIRLADLSFSGVTDISPLKGLPLERLDLRGLEISDISPLEGMPLRELFLEQTKVTDLSPLKGAPLRVLYLNDTPVKDISPLADCPLVQLNLTGTQVADISPVRSLPLGTLWIGKTKVTDLSPLADKHLESLDVQDTAVADLSPLADMTTLRRLNIVGSQVTDLTPLAKLNLTRLLFTPSRIKKGLEIVRAMQSLRELDVEFREPRRLSPAEFWKRYEAGELR